MEPMRAVLAAKFWNEEVESTTSLDGLVHSVPFEPPVLGLMRGSKLSRSQQLLLLQRLFRVPFTPSVEPPNASNKNCGGLVLDRVLVSAGASNWWTTITGRARAQRFWLLEKRRRASRRDITESFSQDSEPLSRAREEKWWHVGKRLLDSSLCALSMRSRYQLGSHTFLSVNSELDSVEGLLPNRRKQNDSSESKVSGVQSPWRGHFSLRHKARSHDLILESAYFGHFVDREARYWEVPHVTTLDLASVGSHRWGLRYRVGLHHSSGDPVDCLKAEGTSLGEVPIGVRPGVRAQAAFSLEKNMHLWKKSNARRKSEKPYNLLASRPHLTLSGIAGGLACAQLGSKREELPRKTESEAAQTGGLPTFLRSKIFMGETSGPVSADLFASLGVTAQFGLFQRLLLDHTKVGIRLDIGAASSILAASSHSETLNPRADPAFPTVALSLHQQLVGPVQARVDSRFSVDPANVSNWPPHLHELTYGADCSLEKFGAAKLVVWYSPTRCEGMAELRILDR